MKTSKQLDKERKAIEKIMSCKYPKEKESDLCYKIISGELQADTILNNK